MDDKTKGIGAERTSGRSDEYISGREALDTDGRIGERGTSRIPTRTPGSGAGGSDTTRNLSSTSSLDAPTEERTREIRAEIEQTRGELTETVNAIQDRLRPSNVAANAAESVKNTVKNAAEDTSEAVAGYARDVADSEPIQYVRANPIPTAMVGIGIAGLTWLALRGREAGTDNRYRTGRTSRDWRRLAPYNEGDRYSRGGTGHTGYTGQSGYTAESGFGDAGFGEAGYPGQGGYESAGAYNPDLTSGARGDYSGGTRDFAGRRDFGGDFGSSTNQMGSDLSRTAQDYSRRAQQTTRGAQRKLQRAWQQNPLMMGAASAVLGLIVGMALPQTEIENEYMGEARDNALEGVQETVREKVNQAKDAATSAVGLISGDQKQSGSPGQPQSGSQGQPSTPATPPAQPGNLAGQSGPAASRPSPQGGQGQQTGGIGQPSKKPGNA